MAKTNIQNNTRNKKVLNIARRNIKKSPIRNRNFLKTEDKLISNTAKLLKNEPIISITDTKIAKKSSVARSTFYFHYRNLTDLIFRNEKLFTRQLTFHMNGLVRRKSNANITLEKFLEKLLFFIYRHRDQMSLILNSNNKLAETKIFTNIDRIISKRWTNIHLRYHGKDSRYVQYVQPLFFAEVQNWQTEDYDLNQIDRHSRNLVNILKDSSGALRNLK